MGPEEPESSKMQEISFSFNTPDKSYPLIFLKLVKETPHPEAYSSDSPASDSRTLAKHPERLTDLPVGLELTGELGERLAEEKGNRGSRLSEGILGKLLEGALSLESGPIFCKFFPSKSKMDDSERPRLVVDEIANSGWLGLESKTVQMILGKEFINLGFDKGNKLLQKMVTRVKSPVNAMLYHALSKPLNQLFGFTATGPWSSAEFDGVSKRKLVEIWLPSAAAV
ncbi:hypothetical protein KFL_001630200 [Klebsormidium nitens]|uniref:Uncharacterized protein n=1 Tax=Klebsormidium nitens TaxID=105231 RepID=A0A1Y1I057_KLENI|nr:hypothetical protein KFL_001630200 [Klebsormidium nitens]|eukprot:GAQ83823.1 hypothetical protein KFL_001630200 [Klebsormidium nitens]